MAFNCDDVYASSARLEEKGIQFKKKPDDGRMKGLAFVYDPDGWGMQKGRGKGTSSHHRDS